MINISQTPIEDRAWLSHSPSNERANIAPAAIFALLGVPTLGTAQAPDGKGNERAKAAPRAAAPSHLCVRLCDGFFFPISYSTLRHRFLADAQQCEQRCAVRSPLFAHRNPGEDVDDMVDLQGRRYRNLPTALLHRTQYVADCTCRGNPWDEAALARHRAYAEVATQKVAAKQPIRPALAQTRSAEREDRWVRDE